MTAEHQRLAVNAAKKIPLEQWGPYLSERQWGTVREDYSAYGDAWHYFPYDHAHCRTYLWGEDGLGGISKGATGGAYGRTDVVVPCCTGAAL